MNVSIVPDQPFLRASCRAIDLDVTISTVPDRIATLLIGAVCADMGEAPSMQTWKVYCQDQDGYVGRQLGKAFAARRAYWDGGGEVPAPDEADPTIMTRRLELLEGGASKPVSQCIEEADVIVANLFHDLDTATALIKAVRACRNLRPKTLVCISTVLTWAGTPSSEAAPLKEAEYRMRAPIAAANTHKLLETLTINSSRDRLATFVIAAGVLYGAGELQLHPLFKQAWLGDRTALPIVGAGTNIIPTVHVADLATIFTRFVERPPPQTTYIVAVDKSRVTQAAIVNAVSGTLGTGETTPVDELTAVLSSKDVVEPYISTVNAVFATEERFAAALEMEWACDKGLPVNIVRVVNEYIEARQLRPLRICVLGAPAAGKTFWSNRIAKQFFLQRIAIKDVINKAKEKGADLQLGKDGRAPVAVVAALVKAELNRNSIRNKGYILDGYPRSLEESKALFDAVVVDGDGEAAAKEEDGAEKAGPRIVPIAPTLVVNLATTDAAALARVKENISSAVAGHSDDKGQARRMGAWNKLNAGSGEAGARAYFKSIEVFDMNAAEATDKNQEALTLYLEGASPAYNYHPTDEEIQQKLAEKESAARSAKEAEEAVEAARKRQIELDAQEHIRKAAEQQVMLLELAAKEKAAVEERAKPLREYLNNVLPQITAGLFEIAKVQPADPVDYLAEYLFRCSANSGKTPAPIAAKPGAQTTIQN